MMPRSVTIAIAQTLRVFPGDTESERKAANLAALGIYTAEAAAAGADIICFSENFNLFWAPPDGTPAPELLDNEWTATAAGLAAEHGIYIILPGLFAHEGIRRNAALLFDAAGEIQGWYFKSHLTRTEKQIDIVSGDELPVFELPFGRIGILICHDLSYLETARILGLKKAEIIFWPSAWSGWGDELSTTLIKSRAIDNSLYLAFVSRGQDPADPKWVSGVASRSCIVNPEGLMLATAERFPCLLTCTIDLDRERIAPGYSFGNDPFRRTMLAERRPELYGALVDPGFVPPHPANGSESGQ